MAPTAQNWTSVDAELPGSEGTGATMLGALAIVSRYRGVHLSPVQLRRDHRLGPGEPD
jgi:hypothetical protein